MTRELSVLVVEDDPVLRHAYIESLRADGHITVTESSTLAEAVKNLGEAHFDAVLLDLTLPDAADIEAVRVIQKVCPKPAIIVITGNTNPQLAHTVIQAGAHEFIEKASKYSFAQELVRKIRTAVIRQDVRPYQPSKELVDSLDRAEKLVVKLQGICEFESTRPKPGQSDPAIKLPDEIQICLPIT